MRLLPTLTKITLSLATVIGSFFLALWLLDNSSEPAVFPDVAPERVATQRIGSPAELRRLAPGLGLRLAPHLKGNIDLIKRLNDREVIAEGWAADPEGYDKPLKVFVFLSGAMVGLVDTRGERPDVTQSLGLFFGAEKNTKFQAGFPCQTGEQPMIFALATKGQYLPLSPRLCP